MKNEERRIMEQSLSSYYLNGEDDLCNEERRLKNQEPKGKSRKCVVADNHLQSDT